MKKLTKKSLEELAQVMPVLSEMEMRECVGGDIIHMLSNGGIMSITPTDDAQDIVVVSNPNYCGPTNSIVVPAGTTFYKEVKEDGKSGNLVFANMSGNFEEQKSFFESLSDMTDVEWGFAGNSEKENAGGLIFTSHEENNLDGTTAFKKGFNSLYHSHSGSGIASPTDDETKSNFEKYGYEDFQIYVGDKSGNGNGSYHSY